MPLPGPLCPYCEGNPPSRMADASEVYGPASEGKFNIWLCVNFPECNALVGIHSNSPNFAPKGTLAREPLRKLRMRVHAAFDPQWKDRGVRARAAAYKKLAQQMGMEPSKCHIGHFDEATCMRALTVLLSEETERSY